MEDAGARRYCESLAMEHRDGPWSRCVRWSFRPRAYNGLEDLTGFLVAREH